MGPKIFKNCQYPFLEERLGESRTKVTRHRGILLNKYARIEGHVIHTLWYFYNYWKIVWNDSVTVNIQPEGKASRHWS